MGLVEGHRALITGGGSGIGRAVAAETGGVSLTVDVTDADAVTAAVDQAASALGGLSIVHANAGIGTMNAVGEMSVAEGLEEPFGHE